MSEKKAEEKKVSRRKFIYAGAGVVAVAAVGGAAYYLSQVPPAPPTPVTPTTVTPTTAMATPTATQTLTPTPTSAAYAKEITLMFEGPAMWHGYFEKFRPKFTADTGIEVKYAEFDATKLVDKGLLELASEAGSYDAMLLHYGAIGPLMGTGKLLEMSTVMTKDELDDLTQTSKTAVTYKGKLLAWPWWVHCKVLHYRTDLIATPPKTWEEYVSIAQKNTHPPDLYGTEVLGHLEEDTADSFIAWLHTAGGQMMDNKGKVLAGDNYDIAVKTLQFYVDHLLKWKIVPPDVSMYNSGDTAMLYWQGKMAMCPEWPYVGNFAQDPTTSKVVGKNGVVMLPPPSWGDPTRYQASTNSQWNWCVPNYLNEEKKNAALMWLRYVTSPEFTTYVVRNVATACVSKKNQAYMKAGGWTNLNEILWQATQSSGVAFPQAANIAEKLDVVTRWVGAALSAKSSVADSVDSMVKELEALVEKEGE